MRECIVRFRVIRSGETKDLRALIFLGEGKAPTIQDYIDCLEGCGYSVVLEDEADLIFRPTSPAENYKIDVLDIEIDGEKKSAEDGSLRRLAENFMKRDPSL